ncbi:MAG: lytic transglycosylase domain-containing protein [Planctomycetes bacterium]|nr:lytic transglycosylase domain-containing protein [Planctomycetota bacterium]
MTARVRRRRSVPAWAVLALLLALGVPLWLWLRPRIETRLRLELSVPRVRAQEPALRRAAEESGLEIELLAGLMFAESSARVDARSSAGALGLFQLLPGTAADMARELGLEPPDPARLLSDAELNARLGARYLAQLVLRFGRAGEHETDVEPALVAYNTGPARLERLVEQGGGWEAWRAERERAGDSSLLRYCTRVLRARDYYRDIRLFDPQPVSNPATAPAAR